MKRMKWLEQRKKNRNDGHLYGHLIICLMRVVIFLAVNTINVKNSWVFSEIIKKFINSVTINLYMEDHLETCICQEGF